MFCTYKYSHSGGIVLLLITLKMNLPHCCQMLELVCDILTITSQLLNPCHKNVRFFLDFSLKLLCLPFAFLWPVAVYYTWFSAVIFSFIIFCKTKCIFNNFLSFLS